MVSRSARRTRADRSEFRTRDLWIDYPWGYPLCYCVAAEVLVRDLGCLEYLVAETLIHVHVDMLYVRLLYVPIVLMRMRGPFGWSLLAPS